MHTKKVGNSFFHLRFEDDEGNSIFCNIISNNIKNVLYYANKVEEAQDCILMDLVDLLIFDEYIWLKKFHFRYTDRCCTRYRYREVLYHLIINTKTGEIGVLG